MTDRLPPHSIDAEEAVLGSLIIDGEAYWRVAWLSSGDFYREKNQWVFEAIQAMAARGRGIDQLTVAVELEDRQRLEAIGGPAYLSHLVGITPTSVHIEHYAGIVREMAFRRRLIMVGQRVQTLAYEGGEDVVSKAMAMFMEASRDSGISGIVTPRERAEMAMERYQHLSELQRGVNLSMGFPALDDLCGAGPGDVIIVGAYPKVGKTTVLMQMARRMAEEGPVLFVSLEMGQAALDHREIARLLGVKTREIAKGKYDGRLMDMILADGIGGLAEIGVYLYLPARATMVEVEAMGRQMQMVDGLVAVVMDYLQLVDAPGKSEYERVSNVSRSLKVVAKALDVPVLAASQLHRPVSHDAVKPPGLMDLRGSGYIEADADVVILLHRLDAFITPQQWEKRFPAEPYPKGKATMMVVANRQGGEVMDIPLVFSAKRQEYREEA